MTRFKGLGMEFRIPTWHRDQLSFFLELFRQLDVPLSELPSFLKLFGRLLFLPARKISEWDDRTVEEFILAHTRHPKIFHFLIVAIGSYFVIPFYDASAGEAIWCSRRMARDRSSGLPAGGTVAIPRAFIKVAEAARAELLIRAHVKKIHVEGGKVKGVELADGRSFESRAVVSTTTAADTLRLVGVRNFPSEYAERVRSTRASMTALQAKIALDRPLFVEGGLLGHGYLDPKQDIAGLSIDDARQMFEDFEAGKIPKMMGFFCSVPTNYDPSLAPMGRQLLSISTAGARPSVQSDTSEKQWKESMLQAFFSYFPETKDHVMWIDSLGPKYIANWLGKTDGPVIGTAQVPGQVAEKRLSHRTPVRGLYLAGDNSAGRGIGVELACGSGMDCADLILSDIDHCLL
jgi:phytoene dehydrogenase-like protein